MAVLRGERLLLVWRRSDACWSVAARRSGPLKAWAAAMTLASESDDVAGVGMLDCPADADDEEIAADLAALPVPPGVLN